MVPGTIEIGTSTQRPPVTPLLDGMILFQKISDANGYSSSRSSQGSKISHLIDISNLTKQLAIPYESRLITAKNLIAPKKTVNIVRLKLSGAVLGKRLRFLLYQKNSGTHLRRGIIVKM